MWKEMCQKNVDHYNADPEKHTLQASIFMGAALAVVAVLSKQIATM